jgi:Domain of unknown function (DUF4150)
VANQVYANGMEIACKSGDAKVMAAMPDVCLSPPSPPAGPLPLPYPVSSFASDTSDGSSSVQISGAEVMLKSTSFYKKCTGDEAATKSFGMGVISASIQGKTYFAAWSSDVKIEGANADRHGDITNSNGQSTTNQIGQVNFDASAFDKLGACDGVSEEFKLVSYREKRSKDSPLNCPPPQTGHHLIPGHLMGKTKSSDNYTAGNGKCHHNTAPVMCALGKSQHIGTHYMGHYPADGWETLLSKSKQPYPYPEALENAAHSAGMIADGKPLEPGDPAYDCVKSQLDDYFEKCGIAETDNFTPAKSGLVQDFAKGLPPVPGVPK